MTPWTPYTGAAYEDWPFVAAWCAALAASRPDRIRCQTIGHTAAGTPILLVTLGRIDGHEDQRPAFWLDGGTHAAEWTSVMAALYAVSRWVEALDAGDAWFEAHSIHVVPCVSPDGFQALMEGAPFLRSTLRPPTPGKVRQGLEPGDLDGDGAVRLMRFRHPAGPFVADPDRPLLMRPRRLDDDPADAWFVCPEGQLIAWDGVRWTEAPLRHGLDLNRNFPGHWRPFEMLGMDGGAWPLSEPESEALLKACAARPGVALAVTNHTYTGAILTQPYRADGPLGDADLRLMEGLARQAVEGTGWRALRVHPDFSYDPKQAIVGVWADTLSTTFGIPAYTLELWDPFGHCGLGPVDVAAFFKSPEPATIQALFDGFAEAPGSQAWRPFDHPQLGPVEIGGLDYQRTVRNPPVALLAGECEKGFEVADRLRRALPQVAIHVELSAEAAGLSRLEVILENRGCLPTSGLMYGAGLVGTPGVSAELILGPGQTLVHGAAAQDPGHLDGWGSVHATGGAHPLYPSLPDWGPRGRATWWIRGGGPCEVRWTAGRAGAGVIPVDLG